MLPTDVYRFIDLLGGAVLFLPLWVLFLKMVVVHSLLLKGSINETLRYPVGQIYNVNEGEWQLCVVSISFKYYSKEEHPNPIPREILTISSNYILTQEINDESQKITVPAVLASLKYGANHGSKVTIGFKSQVYFTVNNAEPELVVKLDTIDTSQEVTGASVFLFALLKRIR